MRGLPSFPATDKRKDPRYKWFRSNYGDRCWELDAMDPNDLRDCVEKAIVELIEPVAWQRCEIVNQGGAGIAENDPRKVGRVMRGRLPNRRSSENFEIEVAGLRYKVTISYFPGGGPAEVFVSNHKAGNPHFEIAFAKRLRSSSFCRASLIEMKTLTWSPSDFWSTVAM